MDHRFERQLWAQEVGAAEFEGVERGGGEREFVVGRGEEWG